MQGAKIQHSEFRIQGRNFCGNVLLSQGMLTLDITQFKKGSIFNLQITKETLSKQARKFLIFKEVEDLMDELISNEGMEISD